LSCKSENFESSELSIKFFSKNVRIIVKGKTMILLVDDEPILLETLKEHLEFYNFKILTATNGAEAIQLIQSRDDIRYLITDGNLPKAKGPEVAKFFYKKFPNGKVCIISGHVDAGSLYAKELVGIDVTYIGKPFSGKDLVQWLTNNGHTKAA
jgi:two-component system cell cycle sensor histidine kinase/response regulator CckA